MTLTSIGARLTAGGFEPEHETAVLDLFAAAVKDNPGYLPAVTYGSDTVAAWFARKTPAWTVLAYRQGVLVGYAAARETSNLPGGGVTPPGVDVELNRMVVHPNYRNRGVGTFLMQVAHERYENSLWATCVTSGASHRLFVRHGWTVFATVEFGDDPAPGVALRPPG